MARFKRARPKLLLHVKILISTLVFPVLWISPSTATKESSASFPIAQLGRPASGSSQTNALASWRRVAVNSFENALPSNVKVSRQSVASRDVSKKARSTPAKPWSKLLHPRRSTRATVFKSKIPGLRGSNPASSTRETPRKPQSITLSHVGQGTVLSNNKFKKNLRTGILKFSNVGRKKARSQCSESKPSDKRRSRLDLYAVLSAKFQSLTSSGSFASSPVGSFSPRSKPLKYHRLRSPVSSLRLKPVTSNHFRSKQVRPRRSSSRLVKSEDLVSRSPKVFVSHFRGVKPRISRATSEREEAKAGLSEMRDDDDSRDTDSGRRTNGSRAEMRHNNKASSSYVGKIPTGSTRMKPDPNNPATWVTGKGREPMRSPAKVPRSSNKKSISDPFTLAATITLLAAPAMVMVVVVVGGGGVWWWRYRGRASRDRSADQPAAVQHDTDTVATDEHSF